MKIDHDLIGKTITGVIASTSRSCDSRQIWMLQFSDGTHVEFVSPRARRALQRSVRPASVKAGPADAESRSGQLSLNVA